MWWAIASNTPSAVSRRDGCVYAIDVPIGREGYVAQGPMPTTGDKY
ncbi:MAG: hypothetical protein U5L09_05160 [Bacteroidales bacterium]|nr:hypothetical protein [Bacteroidales bacterium]